MSEPRYEVKIPNIMNPFTVEVNGKTYSFPAGTTQEVNRAVYDVIRNIESMVPTPNPRAGEPSFESLRDRPFGESTEVLFDQRVELVLPEEGLPGATMYVGTFPEPLENKTYRVIYNGIEYDCTASDPLGAGIPFALGNTAPIGGTDTGEPFLIPIVYDDVLGDIRFEIYDFNGATTATVKIEKSVIHPIDPKFIPAGVGGGVVIVQDSAMASGVAVVDGDATATMNAAEIAEAVQAGKTVYFLTLAEVLLPLAYIYLYPALVSGAMTVSALPKPYVQFGAISESGYVSYNVNPDGSYYQASPMD